ncbi:hypothetical protein DMH03_25605 [Amycolatopsis sp. WAC 01376]|uniref:hypothetical protein n=1 Tax=Amycolatopsis sp. WAC 01376 TaxID=2203195 RepID=UPI000F7A64A6|nr:hypothetical protein [Amycolatopsis sp. WAC 01376]RSM59235.1 hypothetical protein DMH03_25605 [Amycolatopsis sp. WAC 01376]
MSRDAPSWDDLRRRLVAERFSAAGIAALGHAIDQAERILGKAWPSRQFERKGWWPAEFNLFAFHAAALPRFLELVLQFEAAANEPTFATVLRGLKRGVTSADWRHALLQLEVHRALRSSGTAITFEPEISGSRNKADLMIAPSEGSPFLVETTSLARADVDQSWEEYEHNVWQAVTQLELRHNVRIAVELFDHRDDTETATWLAAIEAAAVSSEHEVQRVEAPMGRAEVRRAGSPTPERTFVGAAATRDGWHRLGRALQAKARQSDGPLPVWLRVDALDGFFQFTEFATLDWTERVDRVATNLREDLAGASHLAGVVLSSGPAVALGATDPTAETQTTRSATGCGLRRLISAHTVRETVVVALRDDVADQRELWTAAYAAESEWLPRDLFGRSLPELPAFLAG